MTESGFEMPPDHMVSQIRSTLDFSSPVIMIRLVRLHRVREPTGSEGSPSGGCPARGWFRGADAPGSTILSGDRWPPLRRTVVAGWHATPRSRGTLGSVERGSAQAGEGRAGPARCRPRDGKGGPLCTCACKVTWAASSAGGSGDAGDRRDSVGGCREPEERRARRPATPGTRRHSWRGGLPARPPQHVHRPVEVERLATPRGGSRVGVDLDAGRGQAVVHGLQRRTRPRRWGRRLRQRVAVGPQETSRHRRRRS